MAGYCNVPVGREGISARIQLFYRGEKYDEQQLVVTENPDMWAVFPLPDGEKEDFSFCFTCCEEEQGAQTDQSGPFFPIHRQMS